MPEPAFGLDFGTTNSAIARVGPDGVPELAQYLGPDGRGPTFRSLLYFDREDELAPVETSRKAPAPAWPFQLTPHR